jgi:hypothetical protein
MQCHPCCCCKEGKQICYRFHGKCARRYADLLQSSQTGPKKASRYTTEYMYNAQDDKEIYHKLMDNVHKGKQIYYRVYGQCV